MKAYLYTVFIAALVPAIAAAAPHSTTIAVSNMAEINAIKSEIRDDYRQLNEDRENGDQMSAQQTEAQIIEDKERLKAAYLLRGLKYRENSWNDRSDKIAEPPAPHAEKLILEPVNKPNME